MATKLRPGRGGPGPVALTVRAVAPGAVAIPVPRLDGEFRAQPIGERSEAGRAHGAEIRPGVDLPGLALFVAVDAGAERAVRAERAGPLVERDGDHAVTRRRRRGSASARQQCGSRHECEEQRGGHAQAEEDRGEGHAND